MGGQVNVAVEASPSQDLNLVMSEIREHYETMIGKNRKELEAWYQSKVRTVQNKATLKAAFEELAYLARKYVNDLLYLMGKTINVSLICPDRSGGAGRDHTHRDSDDNPHRD